MNLSYICTILFDFEYRKIYVTEIIKYNRIRLFQLYIYIYIPDNFEI